MGVKINDYTPKVLRIVTKLTSEAVIEFTVGAVARAKAKAPIKTGHHRGEIGWKRIGRNSTQVFSSTGRANNDGYGAYLEFGTRHMPARPHFAPAMRAMVRIFNNDKRWK